MLAINTSFRATRPKRGAARAAAGPAAKRGAGKPTKSVDETKARAAPLCDAAAEAAPAAPASPAPAAPAPAAAAPNLVEIAAGFKVVISRGQQQIVRESDCIDLTGLPSDDGIDDDVHDSALAAPGAAVQQLNVIKTEAEADILVNGVDMGTPSLALTVAPVHAPARAPAPALARAPARAFALACAPAPAPADEDDRSPVPALIDSGLQMVPFDYYCAKDVPTRDFDVSDDAILLQALEEAEAAITKPMTVRQRELLKKFGTSANTINQIRSAAHASKIIDAVMSARNRNNALAQANRAA